MPSGVELATAWVTIVPSFAGVQAAATKGFAGVGAAADVAGAKAGNRFTASASKGLSKLGGVLVAAFAVNKIIDGFFATVEAASGLQEAGAAVGEVFGDSFREIQKWSKGSALGFGQSQLEALKAAKTFGIFGQAAGLAGQANVEFSTGLVELASDLASFHDTSPEEAIIALGAALRGENEPIRRFGILLDDATLRQKALALGIVNTTKTALTPQQKVLAAHAAILEQSTVAQGDFERTSGNLANQQRILNGLWQDFSAELGVEFLPMMTTVVSSLNDDLLPALHDMLDFLGDVQKEDWFRGLIDALGEGGELDLVGGGFVETFKKRFGEELPGSLAHGWEQIKEINKAGSADIATSFEDSWNSRWVPAARNGWTQITDAFGNGWEQIVAGFENGGNQITGSFNTDMVDLGASLDNGRKQINQGVSWLWTQITTGFSNGGAQIGAVWSFAWTTITGTASRFAGQIGSTVRTFVGGLTANFSNGWTQITGFFTTAATRITGVVNGVLTTFQRCANGIRTAFSGIGNFIRDAFGGIGDIVGGVANAFNNFFGGLGDKARYFKGKLQSAAAARQASLASSGGGFAAPGSALARVRATLPAGLHITDTLSNPARDRALGLVRSPNSYHYDARNPAVDIAGPIPLLWQYAARLRAMGGWRQFLWQVAGHYDHIHVAHQGGVVDPSWPRMWGDAPDERTARLQVGETVLPRGWEPAQLMAWQPPDRRRGGGNDDERMRAAVEIRGDVYTTDIDEFFDKAERAKRRAYALAAPAI